MTVSFFLIATKVLGSILPDLHILAVISFASTKATLAAVNHSEIDMDLGSYLYRSKAHDEHHGRVHGNYAQFLKILDVMGGTYVDWEGPKKRRAIVFERVHVL